MTTNYEGDPDNYPANIREPDDGDLSNATALAAAVEDLADRTAYNHAHGMVQRATLGIGAGGLSFDTQSDSYVDVTGVVATFSSVAVGDIAEVHFGPLNCIASTDAVNGTAKFLLQQSGSTDVYVEFALPTALELTERWLSPILTFQSGNTNNIVAKVQIKINDTDGHGYVYASPYATLILGHLWR